MLKFFNVRTKLICHLSFQIISVKQINIYVKLVDGRAVPIQVENVSPVQHVKDRLEAQEEIDISKYVLKVSSHFIVVLKVFQEVPYYCML